MATVLEETAQAIVAGTLDLEAGVTAVAKATKRSTSQVREQLTEAVTALTAEREASATAQAEAKAAKATKPAKAPKAPKEPKPKGERYKGSVTPDQFAAVRDRLGMSNKEVGYALAAVGLGSTPSRVTELTHSMGASPALLEKFTAATEVWRAANPKVEAATPAE